MRPIGTCAIARGKIVRRAQHEAPRIERAGDPGNRQAGQELLEDARKEAAGRYISESTLAIGEVAYLVGYSEPAPFHRAFKRWYGMTPDVFRRRQSES
jgi:AraC-like DNA-binding protein